MTTVSILGAGAWGTALALVAARAGSSTLLWTRKADEARYMQLRHEHPSKLPGIQFDASLKVTADLEEACKAHLIIIAVPAQEFRSFTSLLAPLISVDSYLVIAAKGIEIQSGLLLSEVGAETMPHHTFAVLSGPTFADEVARNLPTAVSLASPHLTTSGWLSRALSHPTFRIYASNDIIGVQIGGALKNVLAIAAGMLEAREMGHNAQASLITRGLAEITRLGLAKGAKFATFSGLSGLGDMCLTCTSSKSRNRAFGYEMGRLDSAEKAYSRFKGKTVEGVATSSSVTKLAKSLGVEAPLCTMVHEILYKRMAINTAIEQILARPLKDEAIFDITGLGQDGASKAAVR